jgi:hypothetical protein
MEGYMPLVIEEIRYAEITGPFGELGVNFRNPKNDELIEYNAATTAKFGSKKWWRQKAASRRKLGKTILEGFDDHVEIRAEKLFFASDPKSEHYREDWKILFARHLSAYLEGLAAFIADRVLVDDEVDQSEEKND